MRPVKHPPRSPQIRPAPSNQVPFAVVVALTAISAFAGTWFAVTPSTPRAAIVAYVKTRTADQNYRGCTAVRAAGRKDIPRWDPSYRSGMDGDGDGLACELPRGRY
ncbi:excalibur calcium-binding domain-containing protein [Brevundimonas sp. NPDC058933]|uniref:excalibur calcium-binding domain-containing protein n=1 Tax=Brevundimonas sp. NPDC058933 TaxID=3346673 RepID=UPI003BEF3DC5